MLQFIIKRIARAIATIFALLSIIFVLFRVMPSDPTTLLLSGRATEAERQALLESFGLTKPLHEQYISFILGYAQGDFGVSFFYQKPVFDVIVPRLLNTLLIVVPGIFVILTSAYLTGSYIGWEKGEPSDKVASYVQIFLRSVPHFVLGIILLAIFSYQLELTPISGIDPIGYESEGAADLVLTTLHHALLPFIVFTTHYLAEGFLLMRGNIISERDKEYTRFLRLKGLDERTVRKHASRNGLLPLITYAPTLILVSIGGMILIEQVFSWPGIGQLLISSVIAQDYPVAQATFFVFGLIVIVANTAVDILYTQLDPRIGGE